MLQFGPWYRVFSKQVEVQERPGRFGSDSNRKGKKKEKPLFEKELILPHYTRAVDTHNQSPPAHIPQHTYVAEDANHFWGMGLVARRF